ncbi:MAG: hypothetical protein ACLP6G_21955 [Terriglobales bacterium]
MSPCLRIFIDSLFDDVGVTPGASLYQKREEQMRSQKPMRAGGIDADAVAGVYEQNSGGYHDESLRNGDGT